MATTPADTGLTVFELSRDAIAVLRGGDVVFGSGVIDYAVAAMLEVLVELHTATGIDLEGLPEVAQVAWLVVNGWEQ